MGGGEVPFDKVTASEQNVGCFRSILPNPFFGKVPFCAAVFHNELNDSIKILFTSNYALSSNVRRF